MGENKERVGSSQPHDVEIWDNIEKAFSSGGLPIRDLLESFPLYARRINLSRFLVHYELFKLIQDLPGSIVECGVYRGASLLTFAKLLEIFSPGDRTRKVIGFDNFSGFPALEKEDGPEVANRSKVVGGWNAAPYLKELQKHIDIFHQDSFVPHAERLELVIGNIEDTAHQFVRKNAGMRISLLHLDLDIYKPTKTALEAFYPLVMPGGIVVLDQYGINEWGGESSAFDDYFKDKGKPRLQTFPISSTPTTYFLKGETV